MVNLSDARADGRVMLDDVPAGSVVFDDLLSGASYERAAADLAANGLYVGLDARQVHLLRRPQP